MILFICLILINPIAAQTWDWSVQFGDEGNEIVNGIEITESGDYFIAGGFSIAATNGGIGLYPIAVAGALALFGIAEEPATAFGWIMWTTQTAMIILFGGLSFLLLAIYNKAK